jgi:paraquat-inducible protein A
MADCISAMSQMSQHAQANAIGCSDCGLVQILPPVAPNSVVECVRCGHDLVGPAGGGIDTPLAFSAAALLLLLPSALSPLMRLISFGVQRRNWLPTGVEALWNDGFAPLATVVFLLSTAIPFTYLGLMVWVLGATRLGIAAPLGKLFRWAGALRPWAMIEVYLVGCCVAYTRLQAIGSIHVDVGGWCLIGATFSVLLAAVTLDERSVWNALPFRDEPTPSKTPSKRTISCGACGLLLDAERERSACPRCQATLHRRKPDALRRTLALVVTGFLLYLPANLLPVLSIERFGRDEPNTILSGVRELISSGLWPLAVIVFTASILVPLMKLFGLSLMLVLTSWRSRRWLIGRTRLYRFIDFIGRWSSIDLFMISILVALVQFGALTRVRPEGGAVAFAAVVVITMIASQCFDPRVMWDATGSKP